jgi:hypothetical protein
MLADVLAVILQLIVRVPLLPRVITSNLDKPLPLSLFTCAVRTPGKVLG